MSIRFIGGAAGVAAGLMVYGVRGRSSQMFAPSVWRGCGGRKSIALTFDDGPSGATPELLACLERYGVKATFFQCGMNVRRLPQIARDVAACGHEIGNHTDSHARLYFRSPSFIYGEMFRAQEAIAETTGSAPVLFRAPYGARWPGLRHAQERLGLLGVMWTVIARDWVLPSERIAERLLRGARNGAIFCLHDGREVRPDPDVREMLQAVRRVIPVLRERGFRFETVSELLCPKN